MGGGAADLGGVVERVVVCEGLDISLSLLVIHS